MSLAGDKMAQPSFRSLPPEAAPEDREG
jgi:hypothetical protein